jgi:hypothetical protein
MPAAGPPAPKSPAAGPSSQILSSVLVSLGLPPDRLSAALVSFARFFSLPLEADLLANVRRQAHTAGPSPRRETVEKTGGAEPPAEAFSRRGREARCLAALAAADKGVELTPAGLEDYAAAIDPDRRDGGQGSKKRRERNHESDDEAVVGDPRRLKDRVLDAAGQDPLLGLLNRLPGKSGRHWLTLPFDFTDGTGRYRASLRVLLDENPAAGRMALEIARFADIPAAPEQRWLFVVDAGAGKITRLEALLWPPRPERALRTLSPKLAASVQLPAECVLVRNAGDYFPFAAENRDDLLLFVNEEV